MIGTDRSLLAQGSPDSGHGSSSGRPVEPSAGGSNDKSPRPGEREAPKPGTPASEDEWRRLKEEADKPEAPKPDPKKEPGQGDRRP